MLNRESLSVTSRQNPISSTCHSNTHAAIPKFLLSVHQSASPSGFPRSLPNGILAHGLTRSVFQMSFLHNSSIDCESSTRGTNEQCSLSVVQPLQTQKTRRRECRVWRRMQSQSGSLEARASSRAATPFVKSDHGTPLFTSHQPFCLYQDPSRLSVPCKCPHPSGLWLL